MEVILLEKMRNLGALGDKVKVKSGYARNYLVPQGKAVYATPANLERFLQRRAELEKIAAEKLSSAEARQAVIQALPAIVITMKAGEGGKLFGSVTSRDIVDLAAKSGVQLERREVHLPESSIRSTGEYEVVIQLDSDVTALLKLSVVAEG